MSSDSRRTNAVPPTLTATSTRSINPPKRFLDFPAQTPPIKKPNAQCSLPKLTEAKEFSSPPKLTRIPQIALTRIDASASKCSEGPTPSPGDLPPLPPLIRMPISTRKEKRSLAAALGAEEPLDNKDEQKPTAEPPRKRARAVSTKVGESSSSCTPTPSTPRKIIQEIFGPDKSKRAKGKGRKRKRGPSPKKKSEPEQNKIEEEPSFEGEEDQEETGSNVAPEATENVNDEKDDCDKQVENVEKDIENEEEKISEDVSLEEETLEQEQEENKTDEKRVNQVNVAAQEDDCSNISTAENEVVDKQNEEDEEEAKHLETEETEEKVDNSDQISKSCIDEALPFFWGTSRRKAKQVAKEKLKRLSQNEEGETNNEVEKEKSDTPEDSNEPKETKNTEPAEIQSRRSTTEGSSKSGSSTVPGDSESSIGCGPGNYSNKHLMIDRQRLNPTPLSLISEDDFNYGKDNHDGNEFQEQKDSDVDSTYSWKPVRAAAAAALEQVTKKQGSGSTGQPGDAEAKAALAAERRARKVMRHKGRSRRTLTFKSSSSKQFTKGRENRYSAQPVVANVVYDHGSYFQRGDIVNVELADGSFMYGQIKGILLDHRGETSAGIRWISPKHPLYGQVEFHPRNYQIRYDLPERLIKIEYVNFIMHCHLDYFNGHPSFTKIEKGAVFTRLGRNMYEHLLNKGSGSDSDSDEGRNKNSSSSNNSQNKRKKVRSLGKKSKDNKGSSDSSNCSTDIEEMSDEDTVANKAKKAKSQPNQVLDDSIDSIRDDDIKESQSQEQEGSEALKDLVCDETLDDEMESRTNDSENSQKEHSTSSVVVGK